jgi:hypothetical protein
MKWLWLLALLSSSALAANPNWPPGATDPRVTQANIARTICMSGYTGTVRPPLAYTESLKRKQLPKSIAPTCCELDHYIPLEIGGHPSDPHNLWPQPWNGVCGAHTKDKLENRLNSLVCHGRLSLVAAQTAIRTDWIAAYNKYLGPLHCPLQPSK